MMSRTRARPLLAADMASARRMRNDAGDRDGKEETVEKRQEGGSKGQEYWLGDGALCLTVLARVDGAILRHEKHLLQEAKDDDREYPELKPHKILVGEAHSHGPGHTHHGIHRCHHPIELQNV